MDIIQSVALASISTSVFLVYIKRDSLSGADGSVSYSSRVSTVSTDLPIPAGMPFSVFYEFYIASGAKSTPTLFADSGDSSDSTYTSCSPISALADGTQMVFSSLLLDSVGSSLRIVCSCFYRGEFSCPRP